MRYRLLKTFLLLIVFTMAAAAGTKSEVVNLVEQDIYEYFSNQYHLSANSVDIGFKRIPELSNLEKNQQLKLSNPRGRYKAGYQTIWLEVYEARVLRKKLPVSFDITVRQNVVISRRKINRGQLITNDLIEISEQSVGSKLDNILTSLSEVLNMETTRFIKPGTIITHNLLKSPPELRKGKKVELRINAGGLSLSTPGIVQEDGHIGEEVDIICESTGKELSGVIQSPELVIVTNNGYIK